MSYTMTIDEPKEAAWFEETRQTMTPREMGALFVMFLRQQIKARKRIEARRNGAAASIQSICGIVHLPDDFDDKNIRAEAALEKYESLA